MPVFISYRHTDRPTARVIQQRLTDKGIKTYLDVLDVESAQTENITATISKNILLATHLIAVMSNDTAKSWWVPFEIGEATITNRRIASYRTGALRLPEYLEMWPQMTEMSHLDHFIKDYLSQKSEPQMRALYESLESRSSSSPITVDARGAQEFHARLKAQLRQHR
jgi:hypothetical protein